MERRATTMNYLRTTGSFVIACHRVARTRASVRHTMHISYDATSERILANEYSLIMDLRRYMILNIKLIKFLGEDSNPPC